MFLGPEVTEFSLRGLGMESSANTRRKVTVVFYRDY